MSEITKAHDGHDHADLAPGELPVAQVEHTLRLTDVDPRAARRAERQVTFMLLLSMLFVVLFVAAYVGIDKSSTIYVPVMGDVGALQVGLGLTLGIAVFLIGAAAIQWAKKLMPDTEYVGYRHDMASTPDETAEALGQYERGKEQSGFARFKMIRRTLIGALVLFPVPLVVLLRDLWQTPAGSPSPAEILSHTMWREGMRIVASDEGTPLRPEDFPVGGLVSGIPAELPEHEHEVGNLNERGKAAIMLVRMDPGEIVAQQGDGWDYQGIVAYSKICTHVGCPIALYEHRTHHLLCPCHQSTFDLADAGKVIFGPAARHMPQLPIGVDDEGYLVAKGDFAEPVGPSFWERG